MSLLLAGVNHKTCPVEIRERLAVFGSKAASTALARAGWREAVVLATCNRFEIYAAHPEAGGGARGLLALLDRFAGGPVSSYAYSRPGGEAVRHLFEVASGLDSLVLGETEILGQVKQAYEASRDAGATGKVTNVLFQRALFVGKSVRTRTTIAMGQVSVASAAVELAKRIFGPLHSSEVLILGAGEMAEKTARHLIGAKVARICLANRTPERALALAAELSQAAPSGPVERAKPTLVTIVPWAEFSDRLCEADIVVASTGALEPVVTRSQVEAALARRRGRSLFFIDIAMPRDVAEDVHSLEGVFLYTMADLKAVVEENVSRRAGEIASARDIISTEASAFAGWLASLAGGAPFSFRRGAAPLPSPKEIPSG